MTTCLTWNLEWAAPSSKRGKLIQETILRLNPDVACYTEIMSGFAPRGFAIEADSDYGYNNSGKKRKVSLWSRTPWADVDTFGDFDLPAGRIISGVSQGIRFVGVCIPWKDAHVRTGRQDREPWEDHLAYCRGLGSVLERLVKRDEPVCILGDFNQRIPRVAQPEFVEKALLRAIAQDFQVATEGMKDPEDKDLIDHVAGSPDLEVCVNQIIPRFGPDGTRLSDHVGILVELGNKRTWFTNTPG